MALPRKVLLKKASKLELKGLEKNKFDRARLSELDKLLDEVYATRRPKPADYHNRTDLICIFNTIAKEIYGNSDECPVVEGFGSFIMDMFSAGSDLDLSINFGNAKVECPRDKKIQALKKFSKKLHDLQRRGHVTGIQTIMSARVPIVKVIDRGTQIECDLSVENWDGIRKSQIVHVITSIDERFQKLSFLMKTWAKANDINRSRDRTLNSLSIISLVAFHLQTRDPPILPPFSLLLKDGTEAATVKNNIHNFMNYGKSNEESVALLFVTLLIKLASVEKLWQKGLCASLYDGSWTSKEWDSQCSPMSVEDFTNRSDNVARAVGPQEAKIINDCIHNSIRYLHTFFEGKMERVRLTELLFGYEDLFTQWLKHMNVDVPGITSKRPAPAGARQKKKKKMKLNRDSVGVTNVGTWNHAVSHFNPLVPGQASSVSTSEQSQIIPWNFGFNSVPALNETDMQVLLGLILQQAPVVSQNQLGFNTSQSEPSISNTPSWPETGARKSQW